MPYNIDQCHENRSELPTEINKINALSSDHLIVMLIYGVISAR
jgi:hypothetical protein